MVPEALNPREQSELFDEIIVIDCNRLAEGRIWSDAEPRQHDMRDIIKAVLRPMLQRLLSKPRKHLDDNLLMAWCALNDRRLSR